MKLDFTESATVEFKETLPPGGINKQTISFANTYGGTIYTGVADDATVVGVENVDDVCRQITDSARDAIEPDVMMFLDCHIENIEDKIIIKVRVRKGTTQPYYLSNKGPVPAGVFVRQGTSSAQASRPVILKMLQDTNKEVFEELPSQNQDLTFEYARNEFKKQGVTLEDLQMKSLGMMMENGTYTNLGLFISDQCPYEIKVAVFQGTDRGDGLPRDRVDFSGSLLKVQDEVFQMLLRYNKTASIFPGKERVDIRDYPDAAMREILLNCIGHRLYEKNYSTQITIFDDRIEFVSPGGLVDEGAAEVVMEGRSILRNPKLAHIFLRLQISEALGIGIPRTYRSYSGYEVQPKVEFRASSCLVVLPNINEARLKKTDTSQIIPNQSMAVIQQYSHEEMIVLALFETKEYISRKDVEEALSISDNMAKRHIKRLVEKGVLQTSGRSSSTKYYLTSKQ